MRYTSPRREDGFTVLPSALTESEVHSLRAGAEAAVDRAGAMPETAPSTVSAEGRRLQTVRDGPSPDISVHWERNTWPPAVRNLRPVACLDTRLETLWHDTRLTAPSAGMLAVPELVPLTSKLSLKRAGVGSAFVWHRDHTFLERILGTAAEFVVTVMVSLDDADSDTGALTVIPGSHRHPQHRSDQRETRTGGPVTIEVTAGSLVIFPSLLMHCSDANHSGRDRRALFYLYRPADWSTPDTYRPDRGGKAAHATKGLL